MASTIDQTTMCQRFRGYLPVVIDCETGGFNAQTDALLEIGATFITIDEQGILSPGEHFFAVINPFAGAHIEASALEFTGISLDNPLRQALAIPEKEALQQLFQQTRAALKQYQCKRAILVGHNAAFDLNFLKAAVTRTGIKRNPFHPFSCFDTATLAALAFGQTVLALACKQANIPFEQKSAHSASYDAARTAELFCAIINRYRDLGGWAMVKPNSVGISDSSNQENENPANNQDNS